MQTKNKPVSAEWTDPEDAPPLTADMFDRAEVFDSDTFVRRGRGRPKTGAAKEQISVRLDAAVLARLRQAGPGWQSEINTLLRRSLLLDVAPSEPERGPEPVATRLSRKAQR